VTERIQKQKPVCRTKPDPLAQNLFWRFGSEQAAHLCIDGYVSECDCMTALVCIDQRKASGSSA